MSGMRSFLFVGGPWDGRRSATGGMPIIRVTVTEEPDLSELLEASIEVLKVGAAAVPGPRMRIAIYRLQRHADASEVIRFDRDHYQFMGWE
jgi:hypothetical protein